MFGISRVYIILVMIMVMFAVCGCRDERGLDSEIPQKPEINYNINQKNIVKLRYLIFPEDMDFLYYFDKEPQISTGAKAYGLDYHDFFLHYKTIEGGFKSLKYRVYHRTLEIVWLKPDEAKALGIVSEEL